MHPFSTELAICTENYAAVLLYNIFNITVSECCMNCVVCTFINPHDDVTPILYFCCCFLQQDATLMKLTKILR